MAESFNSASILTSYHLLNSWLYSFYLPEATGNKFPCFCKNKEIKFISFPLKIYKTLHCEHGHLPESLLLRSSEIREKPREASYGPICSIIH